MQKFTMKEIEQVNGGSLYALGYAGAAIAVAATTYKAAYETATFIGAGALGRWIGGKTYEFTYE